MSYLSSQLTSSQEVHVVMDSIRSNFHQEPIELEDARNELRCILGEEISRAAVIHLAYRGRARSLIFLMAITSYDFEILSYCKEGISGAVSDFNWFWRQLRKIKNLSDLVLTDIKPEITKTPFTRIVRDPYLSGLLTTVIWVLISEFTENAIIATVIAGIVLLLYGIILYYQE